MLFLDIRKNISELSTIVYQIKGLLNGKTLLPFPEVLVFLNLLLHLFFQKNIQNTRCFEVEELRLKNNIGEEANSVLVAKVEGYVVKWIQEVINFYNDTTF